jgi:glycosyltransferase involved in cell wall biosynthesis
MTLISVVIPTRNRSERLERAINSVFAQTFKNWEIIIVDDNSIDDTKSLVEKLNNNKISYINLPKQKGGAAARNIGINKSAGEYIAFLDDDDEWLPEKLAKQYNMFLKSPEIALCYTGRTIIRENKYYLGFSKKYSYKHSNSGDQYRSIMSDNFIGVTSSVMIKKEVLLELNGFDENLPCYQDYELFIRILKKWKASGIDEPLVLYHLSEPSHVSFTRLNVVKAEAYLAEKYKDDLFYPLLKRGLKLINLKKMLKSFHYAKEVLSR